MEQCGRNQMPIIDPPMSLEEWFASREPYGEELMLDPETSLGLHEIIPVPQRLTLLIGPEGGFSDQERERALESGLQSVRLGPRILRTETAVIAGLSAVQSLWGDLG